MIADTSGWPDKLWDNHSVDPQTGCWEWVRYRDKKGYGRLMAGGKRMTAHRYAWQETFGPIPDGAIICHKCDNPCCINPDHLFIGTDADNIADRDKKGRHANTKKTHCKHGHSLSDAHINKSNGRRHCRECQKQHSKRYREKQKAIVESGVLDE